MWARWRKQLELMLLTMALLILGAAYFSRLTPEERRLIELEAGLEQLYLLEEAHYARYGRYFDPTDPSDALAWQWMDRYEWEVRIGAKEFWIVVRADLDRDGQTGAWVIDDESTQVRRLTDD